MVAEAEILAKLILSAVLGLVIGLERQLHSKPAGMRTLSIVAVGATLFTIVSISFVSDQARVVAGIVTGIGFLGAGAIFRDKRIRGLTTAAELWIIAAIGVAVGLGMYFLATATTILVLIVVVGGRFFERKTEKAFEKHRRKYGERE